MGLFVLALFCLLSLTCFGYSSNKHMICKDVDDVFADVTNSNVHTRRLIGPAGKKGSRGERGFPGRSGTIDYDRVQEIVCLKVKEETRRLRVKVDEMGTEIKNLKSQISETRAPRVTKPHTVPQTTTQPTTDVRCVGGVIHEGICYWAEVHSSEDTNYAEAQGICSNKDSTLADINGKVHYDLIMDYLRGKLHGKPYIYVWTGMKKIYENNIAQLSNESPAPYTRQRSNRAYWDDAVSRRTHVDLLVVNSTNDPDQGMGVFWPSGNIHGALCQTE